MDLGLKDRVAIVTGGSKGLGRAEAEALAGEGAAVVVATARSVADAEQVVRGLLDKGGRAISIQADVTRTADVERLVATTLKTFGRLDILVNNAGTTGPQYNKPLVDLPEDLWDFMVGNHLRSVFLCIKYTAPHMIKQGWGRIINTASIHGRVGGRPSLGHYGAAKAGVIALTMTAARELGPKGITANVIAPGFIGTETLRGILSPQVMEKLQHQIPLGRIGEPPEVGRVVAFLASEAASYLNGVVLDINGGRLEYFF
ncbi:MAG TPA: 3-oxoacyl-ACP reductase family protein [Candidatus Methylomirabilis sp.]|nr:3-oxoacyl-ACP reductase family protein [Candidatus Methylomirabilis sp.]